MAEAKKGGTAVININKNDNTHRGTVRGAHNGVKFEFPVGKDVTVTEGQLNALRDSRVQFTTVSPLAGEDADEGSSASSTVTGTATRLEPAEQPSEGEDGEGAQDHELSQRTDEELTEDSQKVSQEQADEPAPAPAKATETKPKGGKGGKAPAAKKAAAKK